MSTLVIGIGNPDRGDDAVGIRVIERLQPRALPDVRCVTLRGDMLALFDAWEGAANVVLVDAMRSGAEPGALRRIDASTMDIQQQLDSFVSTHAFNLAEAIALARGLDRLPERLVVFGIEAHDFTPGSDLSPPVKAVLDTVVRDIEKECQCTKHR